MNEFPKGVILHRGVSTTSSGTELSPTANWDHPRPDLQYNIFPGFGNPLPEGLVRILKRIISPLTNPDN